MNLAIIQNAFTNPMIGYINNNLEIVEHYDDKNNMYLVFTEEDRVCGNGKINLDVGCEIKNNGLFYLKNSKGEYLNIIKSFCDNEPCESTRTVTKKGFFYQKNVTEKFTRVSGYTLKFDSSIKNAIIFKVYERSYNNNPLYLYVAKINNLNYCLTYVHNKGIILYNKIYDNQICFVINDKNMFNMLNSFSLPQLKTLKLLSNIQSYNEISDSRSVNSESDNSINSESNNLVNSNSIKSQSTNSTNSTLSNT